jgi:S-adenosylmethionine-diacylglycerol 3-amino-3-carboxypropyl transferase
LFNSLSISCAGSPFSTEIIVDFFAKLNFTSSNEDGETELATLAGAQRIIGLTGTGTRVLDLLLTNAETVIALDSNPAQNALLALKVAAIAHLDHADYLAFIGITPSGGRRDCYERIRRALPPDARAYWDRNRAMIVSGIWLAGKWERLLGWNARFLALLRGRAVAALMNAATIEEQEEIWRSRFTAGRLGRAIEPIARDLVWRWAMREPAGAFLPGAQEVGARLEADFARASRSFLLRESDAATLALRGRHFAGGALPVHMRTGNFERVKAGLPRLQVIEGGLADLAGLGAGVCDGFSLSDFGSYCGPEDYAACWRGILSVTAPGARFCERIFMNPMTPPGPRVSVDAALSDALSASDKSIIYRIRAGTIGSAP